MRTFISVSIAFNWLIFFISGQFPALREFVQMGKPVWGTCAGLIFLANKAVGRFLFFHFSASFWILHAKFAKY